MEFLDKLGQKASEAYKVTADKTGKLAKEAKLRMQIGEIKSQINNIYQDIGKIVYEKHVRENEYDISKEIDEQCTKIDVLSDEIDTKLKECLKLKDKKQCPKCYTQIEKDVKFCPECGAKQEEQTENVKEVEVVEQNEQEQIKNNNQNNEETNCNEEEKTNLEKTVEIESDVKPDDNEIVQYLEPEDGLESDD